MVACELRAKDRGLKLKPTRIGRRLRFLNGPQVGRHQQQNQEHDQTEQCNCHPRAKTEGQRIGQADAADWRDSTHAPQPCGEQRRQQVKISHHQDNPAHDRQQHAH